MGINRNVLTAIISLAASALANAQVAVHADVLHTMAGPPIDNGVVVIQNGKITAVGSRASVEIPSGFEVIRVKVATPGLIDAHTTVGLSGYLNQPHDQDQVDKSGAIQPELRAIDAYDAREQHVEWLASFGITTIHTGHGPGALIAGQTMIAKTRGKTVDEAVIVPEAMIAATLGGGGLEGGNKSPGTRAKALALLREELIKAQAYKDKRASADESKRPDRSLRMDALSKLLSRETPLLITVNRHNDIATALRLAKELNIRIVLDGATDAPLLLEEIKAAGVSVILHPPMSRATGETENASMVSASVLKRASIPFALQSGFEGYVPKTRVVLFEAAIAAKFGLTPEEALASITIEAAKLLGIESRVGSLEVNKDGDVACYDGDPLEQTSHCVRVLIEGKTVSKVER